MDVQRDLHISSTREKSPLEKMNMTGSVQFTDDNISQSTIRQTKTQWRAPPLLNTQPVSISKREKPVHENLELTVAPARPPINFHKDNILDFVQDYKKPVSRKVCPKRELATPPLLREFEVTRHKIR
jgi:hypothetical protein